MSYSCQSEAQSQQPPQPQFNKGYQTRSQTQRNVKRDVSGEGQPPSSPKEQLNFRRLQGQGTL